MDSSPGVLHIYCMFMQTLDADLSEEAPHQLEPYALITGDIGTASVSFFLATENNIILESKTFIDTICDVVGMYFNFNICYSKQLRAILYYFQFYVFNLNLNAQKFPASLSFGISLDNSLQ